MLGFAVFVMLWTPLLCVVCFIVGAYIMYCKQNNKNPLVFPPWFEVEQEVTSKREEPKGFFE